MIFKKWQKLISESNAQDNLWQKSITKIATKLETETNKTNVETE